MTHRWNLTALLAAAVVSIPLLGGCSGRYVGADEIRGNLSPNLIGVADTADEKANTWAISSDVTMRQIADDFGRFMLLEQPISLHPYSRPH